jgi:hypothetical protein
LSTYSILAVVLVLAGSAAAATFHYYRPGRKRSPEAAVAIFSAILAAGAWADSVLDRANQAAERNAEIAAVEQLLKSTLASADAQAARRDDVLAGKIEIGFLRAGLEGSARVVQGARPVRSPIPPPSLDVAPVRRLAELETEKRLRDEEAAREAREAQAVVDSAIRQLCARESYRNTDRCRELDNPNTEAPASR